VPAFIRITNVKHIIFQVKHVQRAVLIADATGIAFFVIDYRRHGLTPYVVWYILVQLSSLNNTMLLEGWEARKLRSFRAVKPSSFPAL
jgi:hypothetical protein